MKNLAVNTGKPRLLGFDLWRFWGCFTIFLGHNIGALASSSPDLAASMVPPTFLSEFVYPRVTYLFMNNAVPMFLFISGFFALGKPVKENDWEEAKNGFLKYLLYYWKWLVLALVVLIVLPGIWPSVTPFEGNSLWENVLMVLGNFINTDLHATGIIAPVGLNYFFIGLAWLMLLGPLFRRFIQSGNIKMIRTIVLTLTALCIVIPGIRLIASDILAQNPDSALAEFFSILNPLQSVDWGWNNFWIPCFLLGGWFAVDKQLQEAVRKIKWWQVAILGVLLYLAQGWVAHYYGIQRFSEGMALVYYPYGGWIPLTLLYVIIAHKLNYVIKSDSAIGRFTIKFSSDTLGVMTAGYAFGSMIITNQLLPLVGSMVNALWDQDAPIILTLVWTLFNIAYFAVVLTIVHWIKKIPFVGRMFKFREKKSRTEIAS